MSILMITHHRRYRMFNRPFPMAEHLARRGHGVVLLVTADTSRLHVRSEMLSGVKVVEIPDLLWGRLRSGWDPWNCLRKVWYLLQQDEGFDVVHIHETRPSTVFPALAFVRRRGGALVMDWNDWWGGPGGVIEELRPWWQRWTIGWAESLFEERFRTVADGTTVISTGLKKRAIDLGVPPDTIMVLRGGSKVDKYSYLSKDECRARLGLPTGAPLLGFASMDSHLDMGLVFATLRRIVEDRPACKLVVSGQCRREVRELAAAYRVADHVVWTGFVPWETFMVYLGSCDVLLLPMVDKAYNRGRWPNKLMDYLAVGRPVVANPVGDVEVVLKRHSIGLLASWEVDDFASKVRQLLEEPRLAQQLGENGRKLAEHEFAWSKLAGRLELFYLDVLERRQRKLGA